MLDLVGQRFGRLTVVNKAGRTPGRNPLWLCKCDCGGERTVEATPLRDGRTQSCGCLQKERTVETHRRHGHSTRAAKSTEYMIWSAMKHRCENEADANFTHYGGRGIVVCDRWRADFEAFFADMGPRPSNKHSIDRIDNDGNYEPGNCRWATSIVQLRNKRTNRAVIRGDGVRFGTVVEAAESVGVHPTGISATCRGLQPTSGGYGWSYETAALLRALTSNHKADAP